MSEIPMYPDQCPHRETAERCWQCLTTKLMVAENAAETEIVTSGKREAKALARVAELEAYIRNSLVLGDSLVNALRPTASVSKPLTGAELAEEHGFEPVPDWKKDPFVRPMRPMDTLSNRETDPEDPNPRTSEACSNCGALRGRHYFPCHLDLEMEEGHRPPDPVIRERVKAGTISDQAAALLVGMDPGEDPGEERTNEARQPGDPTVRHVVAWMRATYPMNKHAQEWAEEIDRVFLGGGVTPKTPSIRMAHPKNTVKTMEACGHDERDKHEGHCPQCPGQATPPDCRKCPWAYAIERDLRKALARIAELEGARSDYPRPGSVHELLTCEHGSAAVCLCVMQRLEKLVYVARSETPVPDPRDVAIATARLLVAEVILDGFLARGSSYFKDLQAALRAVPTGSVVSEPSSNASPLPSEGAVKP